MNDSKRRNNARWSKLPAGRALKARWRARWKKKNKVKVAAHNAVRKAIASGRLVRPNACSRCLSIGPVIGHHKDYLAKLDVEWLCEPCHMKEHGLVRPSLSSTPD